MNNSMNPIIRSEPFKVGLFVKPPVVSGDEALVLYRHDSKNDCIVYLLDDTIYSAEIRKMRFDRLAYVTLKPFQFSFNYKFPFSEDLNQYADITYDFVVYVKGDRESVKNIFLKEITDISEPILSQLKKNGALRLEKRYSYFEPFALESEAFQRITDIVAEITYLKILLSQKSIVYDEISAKRISDNLADQIQRSEIEAKKNKLEQQAEIRRMEIELNQKILRNYSLSDLIIADSKYERYVQLEQERLDRERDNESKKFELMQQKLKLIKEMASDGFIDDLAASNMIQHLLSGFTEPQLKLTSESNILSLEKAHDIEADILEDGNEDV